MIAGGIVASNCYCTILPFRAEWGSQVEDGQKPHAPVKPPNPRATKKVTPKPVTGATPGPAKPGRLGKRATQLMRQLETKSVITTANKAQTIEARKLAERGLVRVEPGHHPDLVIVRRP